MLQRVAVCCSVLIVVVDEFQGNLSVSSAAGLGASIAGTLASLLFQLVTEKCQLDALAKPLKDLNENQLSKFEVVVQSVAECCSALRCIAVRC